MLIRRRITRLVAQPALRIAGTVTDTHGNPLVRRVLLYDESQTVIAQTWSAADGTASFAVSGANGNNRFVARAIGNVGECDDISCPMRGVSMG